MKPMNPPSDDLQRIPGIGPVLAQKLRLLGIEGVADLRGRDPEQLYRRLEGIVGQPVDRCVLYVFRCAVYFAEHELHEPELLKWWNWKEK